MTTCRRGHERTADNVTAAGRCVPCRREWDRANRGSGYDPIAVERAVAGDLNGTRLNVAERREAVRRLDRLGLSARVVAEQVHTTPRTVHRIRTRLRQETQ